MTKVNVEVLKPWITEKVVSILGFEDDVLINFVFSQLESKVFFSLCLPGINLIV